MGHQKPSSRLHVGVLENAQAVNEKLLMLLISGGNWFAIMTIPHVYRIVVPRLLSPSRHATVGYGETLKTMLGVVV